MIYLSILSLLTLFSVFEAAEYHKIRYLKITNDACFILFSVVITIITAFRYHVGNDWGPYTDFFDKCLELNIFIFEPGYTYLNRIFKVVFDNFYVMQFCISVFCCITIYKFIYNYSKYPIFSSLVYFSFYFYQLNMSLTRQWLAAVILLNGYKYIINKKFFSYCIVVIIASTFHITAIISFICYFICRKVNNGILLFILILSLFIGLFGHEFILFLISLIVSIPFLPVRIGEKFEAYIGLSVYARQIDVSFNMLVGICFFSLMLLMNRKKTNNKFVLPLYFSYLFIRIGQAVEILGRLNFYFAVSTGGFLAYNLLFFDRSFFFKKNDLLFSFRLVIILYFFVYFCNILITQWNVLNPYSSIFRLFE